MVAMAPPPRRAWLVIVRSPTRSSRSPDTWAPDGGGGLRRPTSVDIPTPSEMPADMKKGPFGKFGVNIGTTSEPYRRRPDKRKKVAELKQALKDADELYLATDEDRGARPSRGTSSGRSSPRSPIKRMVFHEITRRPSSAPPATRATSTLRSSTRPETRRILDRLYGYEGSPVL